MFITIEGIDGSGKTTASNFLAGHLQSIYGEEKVILTREPGGTNFAEDIRKLLLKNNQIDPIAELLLFISMRKEHVEKLIHPALKEKKIVICDRFIHSTIAYQGYGYGIDIKIIKELHEIAKIPYPDITFILDVEVSIGLQRAAHKNKYEEMGIDFYNKVKDGFYDIAQNDSNRCHIIESNSDLSYQQILTILKKKLEVINHANL
ncbi:MAG: thymidylate kinase [Candidatus Mesenet longicola]|uniref:Thymidylate kinase n=1 Tax=Candidatus Mesenet longicola TaxID=1892558 RepID=A0A8J3MP71_9RICK|nr:MAG: thymidylate kinase [Candidatus Mesenet longicola]GHM59615.1 MAG: thymidylate kinase [Candidatus Mesenet longicola]